MEMVFSCLKDLGLIIGVITLIISTFFVVVLFIVYLYSKIIQIILKKDENTKLLLFILDYIFKNNIEEITKNEEFKNMYLYLNNYTFKQSLSMDKAIYNKEDISNLLNDLVDTIISQVRKLSCRCSFSCYDLKYIWDKAVELNRYKEKSLYLSWLLQMLYMKSKTNNRVISDEQFAVFYKIKTEIDNIVENNIRLNNEEKEIMYKVFKEENDKFNALVNSLYE